MAWAEEYSAGLWVFLAGQKNVWLVQVFIKGERWDAFAFALVEVGVERFVVFSWV